MAARSPRPHEHRMPAPARAAPLLPCVAAALIGCLPGKPWAEPRAPEPAPHRSAWQRAQHGPNDAITLVRERDAALAAAAREVQAQRQRDSAPHSGFVAERGGLSWQLESGGRLTIKRRHRSAMLFYRSDF